MLIDGEWVGSKSAAVMNVLNPATGELVGTVPKGTVDDAGAAIDAAYDAYAKWRLKTPRERAKILIEAARMVRSQGERISRLLTLEQGKPLAESNAEVWRSDGVADILEFYAEMATKIRGSVAISEVDERRAWVQKEAVGVVGAIIPWNYPAVEFALKAAPALVSGNTVVMKPASTTPLADLELARLMVEAGMPKGVLNVVTGPGAVVGDEIARNPKVSKVTFTGATETGKHVMRLAADTVKRVTMELGGNDPMIVCEDADLQMAANGAAFGRFGNCGQNCIAAKRLYVQKSVFDKFVELFLNRVKRIRVGNGLDPQTTMGPLNNAPQRADVERLVKDALDKGAKLLTGGKRPEGPMFEKGYFYAPTALTNLPQNSLIHHEECFGPALPICLIENLQEGIEKANASIYGLGASIWTTNLSKAMDAIGQLEAGTVWVNACAEVPINVPYGGMKQSGFGRESGVEGLAAYSEMKTVIIDYGRRSREWYLAP
jgi:succinate-semialdehyde dehydrogenase/glutarate-semialdehyde dehydrogenase